MLCDTCTEVAVTTAQHSAPRWGHCRAGRAGDCDGSCGQESRQECIYILGCILRASEQAGNPSGKPALFRNSKCLGCAAMQERLPAVHPTVLPLSFRALPGEAAGIATPGC